MKRRAYWQQKRFSLSSCNGFRNGLESPTLMDRWRITALGKPVLSLPINGPSENPSLDDLKECMAAGLERETVFCSSLGSSFLNTLQVHRRVDSNSGCQDGTRYYEIVVYIPLFIYCLSMESFRSITANIGIRAPF